MLVEMLEQGGHISLIVWLFERKKIFSVKQNTKNITFFFTDFYSMNESMIKIYVEDSLSVSNYVWGVGGL